MCSGVPGPAGEMGVQGHPGRPGDTGATGATGLQVIRRRVARQTSCPGKLQQSIQETHHEMKIPERDVTYIVLSVYLLTLIDR